MVDPSAAFDSAENDIPEVLRICDSKMAKGEKFLTYCRLCSVILHLPIFSVVQLMLTRHNISIERDDGAFMRIRNGERAPMDSVRLKAL